MEIMSSQFRVKPFPGLVASASYPQGHSLLERSSGNPATGLLEAHVTERGSHRATVPARSSLLWAINAMTGPFRVAGPGKSSSDLSPSCCDIRLGTLSKKHVAEPSQTHRTTRDNNRLFVKLLYFRVALHSTMDTPNTKIRDPTVGQG